MRTQTHSLYLSAPKDRVFAFLSEIENLPEWAVNFCQKLEKVADGGYCVITPQGQIHFRVESDAATGVIDMYGGPKPDMMAYWPARVVEWPGLGSLFLFTMAQLPGMSDEEFTAQSEALKAEFEHIREIVEV